MQAVVVVIAFVRMMKLAWHLYRHSGPPILLEGAVAVAPDLLARSALANRIRTGPVKGNRTRFEFPAAASKDTVLPGLRLAEARFLYVWERCFAASESIKRASVVTLLLTFIMIAGGASPAYNLNFHGYNTTGLMALYQTIDQLLGLLAFGLSVCTILYLVSSFFERVLADRKARWTYFCAQLKNEFTHK